MYLVFYDISNNKIRTKVAARLIQEGYDRIQLSVFVGIKNPKQNTVLWEELNTKMAEDSEAKLYVLSISENNFKNMLTIGRSDYDIDYLTGNKHSLFI